MILEQLHRSLCKVLATCFRGHRRGEIRTERPSANREQDLEVSVLPFQEVDLFQTSVHVVGSILSDITRENLFDIGKGVAQIGGACGIVDIGESVKNIVELFNWDFRRWMVPCVYCL